MQANAAKEHRKAACTLELKRFLQVVCSPTATLATGSSLFSHLGPAMQAPILDFGSLKVGGSKTLEVLVSNSDQQKQVALKYSYLQLPSFVAQVQSATLKTKMNAHDSN